MSAKRGDLGFGETSGRVAGRENAVTQSVLVQSTQGLQNLLLHEHEDSLTSFQNRQKSISQVRANAVGERGGDEKDGKIAKTSSTATGTSSKPVSLRYLIFLDREFSEYPGIAWLMDTGCERIAGVTDQSTKSPGEHPMRLSYRQRGPATVIFGTTRHTASEMGDIPLGNGEFVRGIYVLPFLNRNINFSSPPESAVLSTL